MTDDWWDALTIQIVLGYPIIQIRLLLMRCKFYFRLFTCTDDWIMAIFFYERTIFVDSIKIPPLSPLIQIRVEQSTSKEWGIMS